MKNVICLFLLALCSYGHSDTLYYLHNADQKILQEDTPSLDSRSVHNISTIKCVRNTTVGFAVQIETDTDLSINGFKISGLSLKYNLYRLGYLEIKGLSSMAYQPAHDEKHIPVSMQLPINPEDTRYGIGTWNDRPGANKHFPDIMLPSGSRDSFVVKKNSSQMLWVDIIVPRNAQIGRTNFTVKIGNRSINAILDVSPVVFEKDAAVNSIAYLSRTELFKRHLGEKYPHDYYGQQIYKDSISLWNRTKTLLREHNVSIFSEHFFDTKFAKDHIDQRDNLIVIGDYGQWRSDSKPLSELIQSWIQWRDLNNPESKLVLYVADESRDFKEIERVAKIVKEISGGSVLTMATGTNPMDFYDNCPSLSIACCTIGYSKDSIRHAEIDPLYQNKIFRRSWMYNGYSPATPTILLEEDGVAMRLLPLIAKYFGHDTHFTWHLNQWENDTTKTENKLFSVAHTFGISDHFDDKLGEAGNWRQNGDGVLLYPGTDKIIAAESLGRSTPITSLRLKKLREGIIDSGLFTMAKEIDPAKTDKVIRSVLGSKIGREVEVSNKNDPTYTHSGRNWSTDPNIWAAMKKDLIDIIESRIKN